MSIAVSTNQISNTQATVLWSSTDADPVLGFKISVDINAGGFTDLATIAGAGRIFTDTIALWVPGDVIQYAVQDLDTLTIGTGPLLLANDLTQPFTYGPVDSLATAPRYTTLEAVKLAIGIPVANISKDEQITEAIIAGENAIDRELGRSFPDQGSNPQIQGIPGAISNLAKKAAVAVYSGDHSPFGTAGSDDWMGAISVADAVSNTIKRSPLLRGFQVSFGFSS